MGDDQKRRMLRRRLADRLGGFHTSLLTQFGTGAEDFLRRAELSYMCCPACGDEMVLKINPTTMNPHSPEYYFACAKCGLSCFPED